MAYLFLSRGLWLAELEKQGTVGREKLTKSIDLTRAETVTWKITGDEWKYTGECQVALVLDRPDDIPHESYRKESRALKLRVDAYAVTSRPATGRNAEGFRAPRLIRNWYYTTDEPFSPEARLWEGWGKSVELGLCGATRYPWEDTYVVIEILQPDPILAKANPRLQIVGEHDYAVYEHLPRLQLYRDLVLLFLTVCVIGLAYGASKNI